MIFRLGDNVVNAKKDDLPYFEEALERFITHISPKAKKVIFTSCFWNLSDVDGTIERVAQKRDDIFVDCHCSAAEQRATGLFGHGGVASHPGDRGMEMIATKIFERI